MAQILEFKKPIVSEQYPNSVEDMEWVRSNEETKTFLDEINELWSPK